MQVGTKLVVLNLSQQTDSADLLGGFQPVDASHALLPLLEHFQACSHFSHHPPGTVICTCYPEGIQL